MSKYKRRYNPKCFVCNKPIQELHELKRLKAERAPYKLIEDLANKMIRSVVCVGFYKNGTKILRHNNGYCEPGGDNYMKNPELAKGWEQVCLTS